MATLGSLISRRGGNRGVVTRLLGKINAITTDQTLDRARKIHELNKKLQDLHDKIKVIDTGRRNLAKSTRSGSRG